MRFEEAQLKVIKYNHLIANLLIFHNCKSMTQGLKELQDEGMVLTPDILHGVCGYISKMIKATSGQKRPIIIRVLQNLM
ncbi:MAG: Tn3 family transposase [Nitrosomonas sp.]|nr:Tn3 family transposase [Nitrosomonas sp.]